MLYVVPVYLYYNGTGVVALQDKNKRWKEERQASLHQTKKEKQIQKTANPSTANRDPIQPTRESPGFIFKGRGWHASPLFTPKLYLHIRVYCPMSSVEIITDPSERSGVAADERTKSPRRINGVLWLACYVHEEVEGGNVVLDIFMLIKLGSEVWKFGFPESIRRVHLCIGDAVDLDAAKPVSSICLGVGTEQYADKESNLLSLKQTSLNPLQFQDSVTSHHESSS